jgi:RNA polymerase sigma-54 factor
MKMSAASILAKASRCNFMALGPRLDLRQSQSLVMTPQLQQAIRLLALSNQELETVLAEEVEKNPLLELDSDERSEVTEERVESEPVEADFALESQTMDGGDALDADYNSDSFHHDSVSDGGPGMDGGLGLTGATGGMGEDGPDFDSFEGEPPSLADHLMHQAGTTLSGADLIIATDLIGRLDEAGYLATNLLETADRLGVPRAAVERVLGVVQSFDPTGIGARTLGECLALQAREADRYDPAMATLLDNLELLAEGRMAQIKRICHVDDEDLSEMIRELRAYDPKPGLKFGSSHTQSVTPDLFVRAKSDGWAIEINGATLPRVLINKSYYSELVGGGDKASKSWAGDCLASANWLAKALDQRQRTIIKVATEIVKHQDAFFRHGVDQLRPLTLRTIADIIEMHESTVSRVTSNKYLSCDRGLFELKYFFTSSIAASDGGEAVSAEAVKNRIRALILSERSEAILSDDTLVEMLNKDGFDIARRTVAKYREAIGFGSSVQRRRQKAMQARAA